MDKKNNSLFNSKTEPIPPLRPDLNIVPVENNGDTYLYFHDLLGYATPHFALNSQVGTVLTLLDGSKSVQDLKPFLGDGVSADQLLEYIRFLDENRLLHSEHLERYASRVEEKYESSPVHRSVTAGSSFPADPDELTKYLDEAFVRHAAEATGDASAGAGTTDTSAITALYAPHIDPRVGIEGYIQAFSSIRALRPKRVFMLATSHYAELYPERYANKPFILSDKTFDMPLGEIEPDKETIQQLLELNRSGILGITESDRAHRIEHSIELHLLFLNYLWDHDFTIVPILVKGFDELYYMKEGHLGEQIEAFAEAVGDLVAGDEEDDSLFLISGDLSHVGKKFGDDRPAESMFNEIRSFDRMFMEYASGGDAERLYELMREKYDPYRICGFAPLYTFLNIMPGASGTVLSYDLWDERERESAVSYGSILYR